MLVVHHVCLCVCIAMGWAKTVVQLLRAGANPAITNKRGQTALRMAQAANYPKVLKVWLLVHIQNSSLNVNTTKNTVVVSCLQVLQEVEESGVDFVKQKYSSEL